MQEKLLQLPTEQLLEKIGAGNHKPGSGSAAALNAILSCKLLLTVIELTLDEKRRINYQECLEECKRIKIDINTRIGPELEDLFQKDSDQFDRAITRRRERDEETNQKRKNQLALEARQELMPSTELPLKIANLSIELANYSLYIFDHAFRSARGDSGVALSSALSSITGCIAIVSLNLQSFAKNDWTGKIKAQRASIRKEYKWLTKESIKRLNTLDKEADRKNEFMAEILQIRKSLHGKTYITYSEIENMARTIQICMWNYRDLIWKKETPSNPFEILDSKKIIQLLHYAFNEVDTLGVNELNEEIAGIIDNKNNVISISSMYPIEIRNFTTAHELGHALMHNKLIIHRDKPLDKPDSSSSRPVEEKQADKFAACFLMPVRLLRKVFRELYQTDQLLINEETSFALGYSSVSQLVDKVRDRRGFARLIARTTFYASNPFHSLSERFNVSVEAMAIRLEELDLVKMDNR